MLEYGGRPAWIPCIDHRVPASKGGDASVANAVTASWAYNFLKGAGQPAIQLFDCGWPTQFFFTYYERVPRTIARHIWRFQAIDASDWYFTFARDTAYWCKAAHRCLISWRDLAQSQKVSSLSNRGLVPRTRSADQDLSLADSSKCS
jgi:hypothetical protein